ncbi:DNA polymerase Y family protein [Mesorhizobium sp. NBSH29]|uniref:DNA polymerase Y family protein n=1 Tax=Mesorhizobium sp. NBSH29 TaxID=2654249 RepID=UPI0021565D57|nr:DNA polymerase Y family protein [Mesorhizobium sp. NBSH29]
MGRSWRSKREVTTPLIISHRENNTQRIARLDEQAETLRLRPGMGIADARAMYPSIEIIEADPAADFRLLESLADWCDRYTPLVALEGVDGLFLDITGCVHLFGGEQAMLDDILARLFQQGFHARAGLASTPGAAWAAARFLGAGIVEPGEEEELLAPLPLSALRIEPAVRISLESVGLRSVGAVLGSPRAPLARRFGRGLLMRIDQATGASEEAISPRLPLPLLSVERHLAEPIVQTDDVKTLAGMLAVSMKDDLERRGEGARTLRLTLFRVDGAVRLLEIRTAQPLRDPSMITRLFHEKLAVLEEEIDAGYGFELVRLSALAVDPFEPKQVNLGSPHTDDSQALAQFGDRIRARLGEQVLLKPVAVESHIPERSVIMVSPFDAPVRISRMRRNSFTPDQSEAQRPIRLFRYPEPIEVAATELPEGPPMHFRWRRVTHRIARAEGPERISSEWWLEEADAPTRDYFRVEDGQGRRYWVYRQGLYGASSEPPRWFMHGIFP